MFLPKIILALPFVLCRVNGAIQLSYNSQLTSSFVMKEENRRKFLRSRIKRAEKELTISSHM